MAVDIYNAAASIIDNAVKKTGSLKHLCYSSKYKNKKKLFALVFQTMKYKKLLEKVVIDTEDIWGSDGEDIGITLKLVLLYETVLGRGVPIQYQFYEILQEHRTSLVDNFQKNSQKHPDLVKESKKCETVLPRYVRVNTLKLCIEEAIDIFISDGFQLVESKKANELSSSEFMIDNHIPDLLVFCSDTDLHTHTLYKGGEILLQDKASCLPAFVLHPPRQSFIIDACAAPGNKSSHLASIIGNKGVVYSFDLDNERFDVMNRLLKKAQATCVKTILKDFLKVKHDSNLFSKVEYILVDPSCSGSGIVSRMDELVDDQISDAKQNSRLKGLSGFQTAALSHALSFPNVKKVVYSTCSIHKEENEDVVEKACKRFSSTFSLVDILPEWKNRGIGQWEESYKCLRAIPEIDYTNGFFVAMFERISNVETIQNYTETVLDTKFESEQPTEVNKTNRKTEIKKLKECKRKKEIDSANQETSAPFSIHSKTKKKRKGGVKKPVTS